MTGCWNWRYSGENTSWHQTVRKTSLRFIFKIFHWKIWVMMGKNGVIYWTQSEGLTSACHIYQPSHNLDYDDKNVSILLVVTEESEFMLNFKLDLSNLLYWDKWKGEIDHSHWKQRVFSHKLFHYEGIFGTKQQNYYWDKPEW